jgi:small nuclear ribonucleoprotein (snRNP)-like protein
VELKNDIQIRGTLKSVDQYLNIKLDDISVVEEIKYPHLVSCARYTGWFVGCDSSLGLRVETWDRVLKRALNGGNASFR